MLKINFKDIPMLDYLKIKNASDPFIGIMSAETKYMECYNAKEYMGKPWKEVQFIDSPLSDNGRLRCRKLGETIGKVLPNVEIVLMSPLE